MLRPAAFDNDSQRRDVLSVRIRSIYDLHIVSGKTKLHNGRLRLTFFSGVIKRLGFMHLYLVNVAIGVSSNA